MKKTAPLLVCVCGATATGKTDLAFQLARQFKAEIISFDSVQIYKELNIGAAKPHQSLRDEIRHHLIDEISPDQVFTAGDFRRRALQIIDSLKDHHSHIILVGGTGFYLQALLKGMYPAPPADAQIRAELEEKLARQGLEVLYAELCRLDPTYGAKIHGNDRYRILRALEVIQAGGGVTMTEIQRQFQGEELPFPVLLLGLQRKRERLREGIRLRTERMIQEGLIEETRSLMNKYGTAIRPLESVGYKEAKAFVAGEINFEELPDKIVAATMALAKRQATWFKRDPKIHWLDPDDGGQSLLQRALEIAGCSQGLTK